MKVTVENDKGKRKEFECYGLALVAQNGKKIKSFVAGKCDAVQWACICVALDEAKKNIVKNHPLVDTLVRLSGLNIGEIIEELKGHDES